jgi:tetratricopeptide (TPR) repeat protein
MTRNDQYATVLDIWTDTVAKRPNNTRARANLGAAWVETSMDCASGSPAALWAARQAKDQFQIVLAIDPNFRLNVFALAEALERSGDPAAAENLYTQSLAKSPEIAGDLLVERGKLRVKRKDWVDAKADFFAAIQANPADVEAHYCLGVLYQQLGDWIHAESELVNVVAISPNYKDAAARLEQVRKLANATK